MHPEFPQVAPLKRPHDSASRLLRAMASPVRLQVIAALQTSEKNVSALLEEIDSTQPNMSQHLRMLHRAGILKRRRDGANIYYSIADGQIGSICRRVCAHMS